MPYRDLMPGDWVRHIRSGHHYVVWEVSGSIVYIWSWQGMVIPQYRKVLRAIPRPRHLSAHKWTKLIGCPPCCPAFGCCNDQRTGPVYLVCSQGGGA